MRYGSAAIFTNSSMSANVTSNGIDLQQEWIYSIQANWSGPAVGELSIRVSNDNVTVGATGTNPASNVVNWCTYSGSQSSTSAAAGSSSFVWNVLYPGYRWAQLVYTFSSGSGTLNANYFGKSS